MVSGVRSSCDRLSMNSARIRWRRRSSETSSMISQTPWTGDRRALTTSVGPSSRRRVSSPLADPDSPAVSTMASIVGSMNASTALRPTRAPAARPRNWWAVALATSTRRSSSRRTMPMPRMSSSTARSRCDLGGLPLGALRPFEQLADLLLDVDPVRIDRLALACRRHRRAAREPGRAPGRGRWPGRSPRRGRQPGR